MTDQIDQPQGPAPATDAPVTDPAPVAAEPQPARTLTDEEAAIYAAELGVLGYTFEAQGDGSETIGFRVSGNGVTYDYRYNEGDTAVSLMDRIVAELGG